MSVTSKQKKEYITFLKVFSAFAVVMLHVNGVFFEFSFKRYWISSNFIECLFYFAVPVFYMITGATLINYRTRYTTREYFKKRWTGAVIPWIVWLFISMVYSVYVYAWKY